MSAENPPDAFVHIAESWRPQECVSQELITPGPAAALAAFFDDPAEELGEGAALPPLWHWIYFVDRLPQRSIAEDGHARDAALVPPLPTLRRMYGGGRLVVLR